MKYRSEIDGLRALAVVPVILFHAGFELFSGGFVGVDVFFVISGYLITSILISELEDDRFSLLGFYDRRARRILPALFFVILVCLPMAWAWMLPEQLIDFAKSLIAVSFFVSNVLFWRESDYFAAEAEEKPMLHTWSLAVEEQYYLIFPVLLMLTWRFGKAPVFWMLVGFSAISLALSEWGWRNEPTANFYLAPTRAWELFAGSLAAFITRKHGVRNNDLLAALGLGLILFSIFFYDKSTPFPSLYALVPVLGVVLILLFGGSETLPARWVLSTRICVGIGLISYSAYLWHQPLFAFARIRLLHEPSWSVMLALSALSLCLAVLSWRFVEQPFRGKGALCSSQRAIFSFSLTGLAALIAMGVWGLRSEGLPQRVPAGALQMAEYGRDQDPYAGRCAFFLNDPMPVHPVPECSDFLRQGQADVMFIGDSHSQAITHQAQLALRQREIGSYAVSYSGCPGLPGFYRVDLGPNHRCDNYNQDMLDYARSAGIKTLVITSRFVLFHDGGLFDNHEGGVEHGQSGHIDVISAKAKRAGRNDPARRDRVLQAIGARLAELSREFNIVLVYPIPEVGFDVPDHLARCYWGAGEPCGLTTSYARYKDRSRAVLEAFDALELPNLRRVRPADVLCNGHTPGRCRASQKGAPLYFDDDHLADSTGAALLAPLVVDAVMGSGASDTGS